jgi:DnaK suppressor protein
MNRMPFRAAAAFGLTLFALPTLALEPLWPPLAQPRPARVLAAVPEGTPSAVSGDPTWPALAAPKPAISYPARTERASVYEPPVDAATVAMAASQPAPRPATAPALAAR